MSGQQPGPREVPELLSKARRLIDGGQPRLALQAVITALRLQGVPESKIHSALDHARLQHRRTSDEDDLSALLAHCALGESSDDSRSASPSASHEAAAKGGQQPHFSPPRSALSRFSRGGHSAGPVSSSDARQHGPIHLTAEASMQIGDEDSLSSSHSAAYEPSPGGSGRMAAGFQSGYTWRPSEQEPLVRNLGPDHGAVMEPVGRVNGHQHIGAMQSGAEEMEQHFGGRVPPASGVPILAERGAIQVVRDASADGSSFTCPRCLGVVAMVRRDEHYLYWCSS